MDNKATSNFECPLDCGNRHGYGNDGRRQTARLPIPCQLHPIIPHGMRQNHLITPLHTAANKMGGGNITVRQSPAYSPQAQGSVERFHRTLMGQIRTLRAQLQQNYHRTITSKHPIVPWLVRHTAHLLYPTDTQHMRMATPASFTDGTKTTEHHSVSLGKQRSTYCQQSSNYQRWNNMSSKPFGLEGTQQQEKHSWASATKLSEQEQSDACPRQTSMTV